MIFKLFLAILSTLLLGSTTAEDGIPMCPLKPTDTLSSTCESIVDVGSDPVGLGSQVLTLLCYSPTGPWVATALSKDNKPVAELMVESKVDEQDRSLVFTLEMTMMDRNTFGVAEIVAPTDLRKEVMEMFNTVSEDPEMHRMLGWMLSKVTPILVGPEDGDSRGKPTNDLTATMDPYGGDWLCAGACLYDCQGTAPTGESCLEYCARICSFLKSR